MSIIRIRLIAENAKNEYTTSTPIIIDLKVGCIELCEFPSCSSETLYGFGIHDSLFSISKKNLTNPKKKK